MTKMNFPIDINYTQVIVHRPGVTPGHIWTNDHVAQGFAWSEGSVSFGVPDHDDSCYMEIDTVDTPDLSDPALSWAVGVPFSVVNGSIKAGTVGLLRTVAIPSGRYGLAFLCHGPAVIDGVTYAFRLHLLFVRNPAFTFAILKSGPGLTTDRILREEAYPA